MSRARTTEAALRTALWLALGGWVGAWGFFAFVVSRVVFKVVPGNVVGDLVGSLLHVLHLGGAVAGVITAIALAGLGQRGFVVAIPLILAVVSLGSELGLSPQIAMLRPSTLGAASTEATQTRFRLLHGISLGLFMTVHVASVLLLGWVAWLETRDREPHAQSTTPS